MRKKLTALLLACLLLVCLVLPVSAADAPALYGTANAADGTVTVTLSLRGGSAVRSGAFTLSYDSSLTLSKTEKGLPLAVANTKEKGKVVCNWVGGAAEADQAVLTLTFTNAATKSYTFKVSGAKVTDKNYETTKIADFPIRIYVACNGKNCPSKSYKDVLPGCHSDARHGRHGPRPRRRCEDVRLYRNELLRCQGRQLVCALCAVGQQAGPRQGL